MVFGDERRPDRLQVLLSAVCANEEEFVQLHYLRLRDAWVEKGNPDPLVAIYTRNGGGNRECYCGVDWTDEEDGACTGCRGDQATKLTNYVSDADDEFDSTYRTYRFKLRTDLDPEVTAALREGAQDEVNMSEVWLSAVDAMKK